MAKKTKPPPDDPEQYARFVKTAEQLLGEDAQEKLEEAMKQILRKKSSKLTNDNDDNKLGVEDLGLKGSQKSFD